MEEQDQTFLDETRELWSRRAGHTITVDEAKSIIANVSGFFQILSDWDRTARNTCREQDNSGENLANEGGSNVHQYHSRS